MYINQKRVINIDTILIGFTENERLRIIVNNPENYMERLVDIGFSSLTLGDSILPKTIGSVSRYNADGKYEFIRDLPKEPYSISRDMTFFAYGKHEITQNISFTYYRFQRKLISAPSEELFIINDKDNNLIISSNLITYKNNKEKIKHIINLFLELFGECQLVDEDLISRVKTPIRRLNWNLLPKGRISWKKLEEYLVETTDIVNTRYAKDIFARINYINSFEPTFIATGNGGFNDYIVLGFEEEKLFILENRKPQNATYVFCKNWEEITKLTKSDILREHLQEYRILHTTSWKEKIKEVFLNRK